MDCSARTAQRDPASEASGETPLVMTSGDVLFTMGMVMTAAIRPATNAAPYIICLIANPSASHDCRFHNLEIETDIRLNGGR